MRWPEARVQPMFVRLYACITGVLALVAALILTRSGTDPTAHFIWIAAVSSSIAGLLVAIAGIWSASGVYLAIFWCFHFGLVVVLASGYITPTDLSPWDESWALSPFASEAAVLALAGALAFSSGACLILSGRSRPAVRPGGRIDLVHAHGFAGSVLVFGAIATWCAIVVFSGGLGALFSSYEDYLQTTGDFGTVFAVIWPVLGCGIVMSVTGKHAWYRTAALVAFGAFSLVALPLGLRSEVMFPTVAVLIALARGGKALTALQAAVCGVTILLIIPIVRDLRESGVRALPKAVLTVPGLDALVEMGGSLHPVEKVVRWHAEGEPYEKGASYWAPFERAATRLLPGEHSSAADDDLRLMNVLVLDRIGAIGFSPVAEAYRNFGPIGVVIVMGILGVIIGAIDTVTDPIMAVRLIAIVYVPLLTNIRNSFVSVPAQFAVGIVIAVVMVTVRHMVGSVLSRPHARAAYVRSEI